MIKLITPPGMLLTVATNGRVLCVRIRHRLDREVMGARCRWTRDCGRMLRRGDVAAVVAVSRLSSYRRLRGEVRLLDLCGVRCRVFRIPVRVNHRSRCFAGAGLLMAIFRARVQSLCSGNSGALGQSLSCRKPTRDRRIHRRAPSEHRHALVKPARTQ